MRNKALILVITMVAVAGWVKTAYGYLPEKDSIYLYYNLKDGEESKILYTLQNKIFTEMMGMTVDINQNIEMYYTRLVQKSGEDRTFTILSTIDRIVMIQKVMEMEMSYDSEQHEVSSDPTMMELKKTFDPMIGKVITMKIDGKGNLIESDYTEVMSSASIGGGFHFDNSKTWFTIFPDKGLLPGHSWTTMLDLGEGEYNMTNSTTYTLKTCSKKKAVINFAATISSAENSKISITSGDMSGMMVINPRTGAAIEIDQVQNIKMNIEEEDIKVPLTLESTAHMEVIR